MALIANLPQPSFGPNPVNVAGVYLGVAPDSFIQWYEPNDNNVSWATTTFGIGSVQLMPFVLPHYGSFNSCEIYLSQSYSATNAASSQAQTVSMSLGLYTLSNSSLSLATSVSTSLTANVTNNVSTGTWNGLRNAAVAWNLPLSPGNYWFAMASSSSSAGNAIAAGFSNVIYSFAGGASAYSGPFGGTVTASRQVRPGGGILSVSSSVLPASIALSDIQGSALGNTATPVFNFANFTA